MSSYLKLSLVLFGFLAIVFLLSHFSSQNVVIPGTRPIDYYKDQVLPVMVNKITSIHTQIPFAWHDLPGLCAPPKDDTKKSIGFIQVLMGEHFDFSPFYKLQVLSNQQNVEVCQVQINSQDAKQLAFYIQNGYRVHWNLDSLPAGYIYPSTSNKNVTTIGWPLGFMHGNAILLGNHLDLLVKYIPSERNDSYHITYFQVNPSSFSHEHSSPLNLNAFIQSNNDTLTFHWTFSVKWELDSIDWNNRWNHYALNRDNGSKLNLTGDIAGFVFSMILSGTVALILVHTLSSDLSLYNTREFDDNETGWELIHGDVFRPPPYPMLLASCVGTGIQLAVIALVISIMIFIGFTSPESYHLLITISIIFFIIMSFINGFFSTRTFMYINGSQWKKNALWSATMLPAILFTFFSLTNFIYWGKHSSSFVPFRYLIIILSIWCFISVPLTLIGSYFAWNIPISPYPIRTHQIPRQIPDVPCHSKPKYACLASGVIPFAVICIELYYFLYSIGLQQIYLPRFSFLIFTNLVVTCSSISITLCYFQLCTEDHRWWWYSFLYSGSSSLYALVYCLCFLIKNIDIATPISLLLCIGYSIAFSTCLFLLTGSIGFLASFWFVNKIYSSLKID